MDNILTDRDYLLWRLLTQTRNAMLKARTKELADYSLTPRQAAVLMIIEATQGDVTAYKIARWTVTEPHTISTLLNRMEGDGLIKRTGVKVDRRKTSKIELTDRGREAYTKVMKFESLSKIMDMLTQEDKEKLHTILKKLRDEALKQIGIRAALPYEPL